MPIVDLDPQPLGAPLTTPQGAFVTPGVDDMADPVPERSMTPMTGAERALGMAASAIPGGSLLYSIGRSEAFGPSMRKDNLLASAWSSEALWADRTPDGINPFDQIKGTKYEQYPESFIGVVNQRQFDATQRDIDREEEDNKTLASLPWYQTMPAALLSNMLDPTVVIPGGGFYRGAKGGFSVLKTAASVGLGAGAQSAVQEAGLQAIQNTRSGEESAINIGSSVVLGGLLGWGGAALLSRGEMRGAVAALDRQLGATGSDAAAIISDIKPKLIATGMSEEEASANAAIVAARYTTRAQRLGEGTGADLYRADMAEIRGPGATADAVIDPAARQFFQSGENAPTFYSSVLRSVETAKQEKAPAAQWLGTLKNTPGVKPEEMEWLGLEGWLKEQKGTVTKQQIADYVRANQIEVQEVEKGDKVIERPDRAPVMLNDTKFSQYTLPGGKNYRELLLTLPSKKPDTLPKDWSIELQPDNNYYVFNSDGQMVAGGATRAQATSNALFEISEGSSRAEGRTTSEYRSSHFDEPNILAHVRFNDRVIDGKRTLFLEEVQSDWHQAGKRRGYKSPDRYEELSNKYRGGRATDAEIEEMNRLQAAQAGGVPDAPFKTTWPELSLKRMIRYAAEKGYDQIAWTTGKTQAARYDLSKQVSAVRATPIDDGYVLSVRQKDLAGPDDAPELLALEAALNREDGGFGLINDGNAVPKDKLSDYVGKELADKIEKDGGGTYSGLDLQVGGEGMSGFYDKMLPAAANKLVKKYGGKVERGALPTSTRDGGGLQNQFNDLIEEAGGTPTMASGPVTEQVHVLPLTDKMKESALGEGFPLFQGGEAGPRGRITLSENKAIIDLFKGADQSTFMHEAGHLWLDELVRDAARGNVQQAIKDDLGTVLRWLKVDKVEDIGRAQHEQWAQAFERYLAEGKAPSSALAQAFEKFKQWLTAIYKSLTDMGAPLSDDVRGVMDRLLATDDEIANALAGNVQFPHSVGAAAVTEPTTASLSIAGRVAGGVAAGTQRFNPGLRLMHSPSAASRNIATNLFEMAQYLAGNETGMPSPRAAETLIKQWDGGLIQSEQATKRLYAEFRKRTGGSYNMVDRVGDMFGSQRASFYEEVGRSMRRNDENPIPEIAAAAKVWRERVFDPLKEAAIKAGLLPPDVSVDTALSYFSRMWNTRRLQAEEFVRTDGGLGFKPTVENWVRQNFPTWKAAFERSAQRRIDPLQREIDDIEMAKLRRDEELKQRGEGELTGEDEGYIRQAIRIVQGGAPKPKDVETLTQFIRREGGLVEDGGELRHMGINNRSMPNFIRKEKRRIGASNKINGGGWDTDAMARHAWENGFFPEHSEPPSRVEFLDALSDDFNKRRAVVRQEDRDAFRLVDLVNRIQDDLARIGVEPTTGPRFSTSDEVKGVVKRIHDALNLEADDKIAKLKEAMVERQSKIDEEREIQFKGDVDEMARDIANEVWNTLTGRGSQGPRASFITVKARGPLKERTFNIPDGLVERWLESDVSLVGKRYTRTMAPDVELARKFGSPDMEEELAKIGEEYHRLRAAVGDNARKLTAIGEQEKQDLKDIRHVRDIIRDERSDSWHDYGKMVRVATALQYMLKMGQVVLSSLTEPVRVVAAKGLTPIMSDGFSALRNLDALKLSIKEAQAAGNIGDRAMASRTAGMYDIMDFYGSKGPIEKFIDNMTNVASHWNGIRLWTDFVKSIASTRIQNQILDYVSRLSELSAEEKRYLKFLSLSDTDAERIARLYEKHGENYDGVRVAATEEWTRGLTGSERAQAELAVEAYRAALNKDLDSMVVTRGAADLPSFANTPLGKVLFQFNTFNLASHQRVLLRGLQEGHARFLSGVVALSSMGMLQTYLTAIATNSIDKLPDPQKNPGWWISEGLDRSGFFSIPMYLANSAEKLTGINPIKRPITWAMGDEGRQGSQKNRNRNRGSVLGPTVGSINDALDVASIAETVYKGDPVSKAQQNAAERVLPYNSFVGVRQLLKFIINPPTE